MTKYLKALFILLLLGDLTFSFIQYYDSPLYGDIQGSVLPEESVQKIFDDPLGFKMISTGNERANPNRFFAQFFFTKYFQKVPFWLQNFVSPISSVYLASALMKLLIQLLFIFILASLMSGKKNPLHIDFLKCAIIITPLFQVYGYWSRMGIVDQSIAYTFFYALPLIFLMLFLLPFFKYLLTKTPAKKINYIFLVPFVIILPLSGPLIPAIIILVTSLVLINYLLQYKNHKLSEILKKIPLVVYILLIPSAIWSIYSLFLGFFDSNYHTAAIPVSERFLRLPKGIFLQLFHSLGFPLMLLFITLNIFILKKSKDGLANNFIKMLKWIGIFALVYILLLPFGGYRPYRPYIIRYDTFMPVNVALFYVFGTSCFYLTKYLTGKRRKQYFIMLIISLLLFTLADLKGMGKNRCERMAFEMMSNSKEDIVAIPKDCFVLSWQNNFDYKKSEKRAEAIRFWRITNEKKLFYNESKQAN